ncbi:MAG TPA: RT0821/Lpp0805 family surface protein [Rhizomicrobium sp.]|jgi:surface antigen|nr:RT0821/Lpp0805 family surface protein [Rhizomicrobium sp.]
MKKTGMIAAAALVALAAGTGAASAQPRDYYGDDCRQQNTTTGTVLGAIAGGILGGAVSHGNGGAVVGGVILGGLAGNAIGHDMDCQDRPYAFRVYNEAFVGPVGRRYEWDNPRTGAHGWIVTSREYWDHGYLCRDFREVTFRNGQKFRRDGEACREQDGGWHFR